MKKIKLLTSLVAVAGLSGVAMTIASCGNKSEYNNPIPTELLEIVDYTLKGLQKGVDISTYKTLDIPSGVKIVDINAFNKEGENYSSINKVIINSGLKEIRDGAFAGLTNCTSFDVSFLSIDDIYDLTLGKNIFGTDVSNRYVEIILPNVPDNAIQAIKSKLVTAGVPSFWFAPKKDDQIDTSTKKIDIINEGAKVVENKVTLKEWVKSNETMEVVISKVSGPEDLNVQLVSQPKWEKNQLIYETNLIPKNNYFFKDGDKVVYDISYMLCETTNTSNKNVKWIQTIKDCSMTYKKPAVGVLSISVERTNDKTFYNHTDIHESKIYPDDILVKAQMSDGTSKVLNYGADGGYEVTNGGNFANGYAFTLSEAEAGNKTLNISYTIKNVGTYKTNLNIPLQVFVPITLLSLNVADKYLGLNETLQLNPTILPSNPSIPKLEWESSDPNKVSVDQNGLVTPQLETNDPVTITVKTTDGTNLSATCEIKQVKSGFVHVTKMTIPTRKFMYIDSLDTLTITPTIQPNNATNKNVKFTSSDTSVAKIDENTGVITHQNKTGDVTITAETLDNHIKQTCTLNVKKKVEKITIKEGTEKTLPVSDTLQLTAEVEPATATVKDVVWTTSNKNIATVDTTTGLVTTKATPGTAIIKCTSKDEDIASGSRICAEFTITSKKSITKIDIVEGLRLNKTESKTLTAKITPSDVPVTVKFETDNDDVTISEVSHTEGSDEYSVTVTAANKLNDKPINITCTAIDEFRTLTKTVQCEIGETFETASWEKVIELANTEGTDEDRKNAIWDYFKLDITSDNGPFSPVGLKRDLHFFTQDYKVNVIGSNKDVINGTSNHAAFTFELASVVKNENGNTVTVQYNWKSDVGWSYLYWSNLRKTIDGSGNGSSVFGSNSCVSLFANSEWSDKLVYDNIKTVNKVCTDGWYQPKLFALTAYNINSLVEDRNWSTYIEQKAGGDFIYPYYKKYDSTKAELAFRQERWWKGANHFVIGHTTNSGNIDKHYGVYVAYDNTKYSNRWLGSCYYNSAAAAKSFAFTFAFCI